MKLLLITSEFPYGSDLGETFIESEIAPLSQHFDHIYILAITSDTSKKRNIIPTNISVYHFAPQIDMITLLKAFFSGFFWMELFRINFSYRIATIALKYIAFSYQISTFIDQKILQENDIKGTDVAGYSYWLNEGAGALSILKAKKQIKIAVSRMHGWDVYFERHPFDYLPLRRWLYDNLDMIFSISQNGKEYLSAKLNKSDKISVSRLGINNGGKSSFTQSSSILKVVSCSYVIELKRVDLIFKTLQACENISIEWSHYGRGPLLDKLKELQAANTNKGLKIILYGEVPNALFLDALKTKKFSLFINMSTTEGIPVTMMEAMSYGIPCMGTNVGGVSEIISNGVNGWLLPANPNPAEAAVFVKKYFDLSLAEKIQMSENARSTWESKYNAEKNYNNFINQIYALS